jgi:hypothetical protein
MAIRNILSYLVDHGTYYEEGAPAEVQASVEGLATLAEVKLAALLKFAMETTCEFASFM